MNCWQSCCATSMEQQATDSSQSAARDRLYFVVNWKHTCFSLYCIGWLCDASSLQIQMSQSLLLSWAIRAFILLSYLLLNFSFENSPALCPGRMSQKATISRLQFVSVYFMLYTVSQKMTLMLHTITTTLIINFGNFWQRCCRESILWNVICYPTSPSYCLCTALSGEKWTPEIIFSVMVYAVSRKRRCFSLPYLWHSSTNFDNFLHTITSCY